jgi:hypothetical protein
MSDEHVTTMPAGSEAIELLDTYQDRDLYRDSTVPIVVACRADVPMDSNTLRRIPDKHGNLQRNTAALDEVEGILTASSITIRVTPAEPTRQAIRITVTNETGTLIEARRLRPSGQTITIDGLAPGAYTIDAAGTDLASPFAPVSSDILIWESPEVNLNTQ